jgi:alkanesulfonate monooxygenase SsuD/methylene tetrahydromethanopterin reductase-like flavin-dependent oxidoreductase (luciferase family)
MRIGIGLPNTTLDVPAEVMLAWAGRAEARGFSTLATIDRIDYPSHDSLVSLAMAGAATERIGLLTNILLAPAYAPVMLARASATIARVTGGRLTLGLGVGGRREDYALTGRAFGDRGKRFDDDLELLHAVWAGEPVDPSPRPLTAAPPGGRVPLLIGGQAELAAPRAARWGAGYTIGGAPPEAAGPAIATFKAAYAEAGGQGEPRVVCLSYFSMGEAHTETSLHNLRTYYGSMGPWAEAVATGAPRGADAVRQRVAAFEATGADELIFDPTVPDLDQIELLADAVLEG